MLVLETNALMRESSSLSLGTKEVAGSLPDRMSNEIDPLGVTVTPQIYIMRL